jgi:hypothetical protein
MLKIFEFYVLLLFTVGYHGNQNIIFFYAGGMYIFLNWRLQLKCLKLRDLCKMVILRNQWIKEYLINLDNRKLYFWKLQTSPQFPYLAELSKITLQGVLYQYILHENAKSSFCTRYLHKPENLMAGDIYITRSRRATWQLIYTLKPQTNINTFHPIVAILSTVLRVSHSAKTLG